MARTDVRAPLDSVGGARGWTLCLTRAWRAPAAQRRPFVSPPPLRGPVTVGSSLVCASAGRAAAEVASRDDQFIVVY